MVLLLFLIDHDIDLMGFIKYFDNNNAYINNYLKFVRYTARPYLQLAYIRYAISDPFRVLLLLLKVYPNNYKRLISDTIRYRFYDITKLAILGTLDILRDMYTSDDTSDDTSLLVELQKEVKLC